MWSWARELRLHKADEGGAFRGRIKRGCPWKEEVPLWQGLGDLHICKVIFDTANARPTEAYFLQVNTRGMADESGDKLHRRKQTIAQKLDMPGGRWIHSSKNITT